MRAALTGATIAALAVIALCGVPRLLGTGCIGRPLGIALAREESDFPHCNTITPLFSTTE